MPSEKDPDYLDKLEKLVTKEEKALLLYLKSGGQNARMTLSALREQLDALGKQARRIGKRS